MGMGVGACAIAGAGMGTGAGVGAALATATAGAAFTAGLVTVAALAGGGDFLTVAGFSTSSCTALSRAAEPVAGLADRAAKSRSSIIPEGASTALT